MSAGCVSSAVGRCRHEHRAVQPYRGGRNDQEEDQERAICDGRDVSNLGNLERGRLRTGCTASTAAERQRQLRGAVQQSADSSGASVAPVSAACHPGEAVSQSKGCSARRLFDKQAGGRASWGISPVHAVRRPTRAAKPRGHVHTRLEQRAEAPAQPTAVLVSLGGRRCSGPPSA